MTQNPTVFTIRQIYPSSNSLYITVAWLDTTTSAAHIVRPWGLRPQRRSLWRPNCILECYVVLSGTALNTFLRNLCCLHLQRRIYFVRVCVLGRRVEVRWYLDLTWFRILPLSGWRNFVQTDPGYVLVILHTFLTTKANTCNAATQLQHV
jgi:hypothetical protein